MLDSPLINSAAPPGSMRYFSVLYAPEERREALTALYVVDAEIRASARAVNHDVAHTRLQWWRAEVDRLVNGAPLHPATRVLHSAHLNQAAVGKLHEVLAAADMDLARMTYSNARELRAYCSRSGGALMELMAALLIAPDSLSEALRSYANRVGVGVRHAEIVRDLRQDAYEGRLYAPLERMDALGLRFEDLQSRDVDERARNTLKELSETAYADLGPPQAGASRLRPIAVLAALHRRLLDRIAARNYDVASGRMDLGPVETPWVAWRAARRAV